MLTVATTTGERRACRRLRRVGPCRVRVYPGYREFVSGLTWDVSRSGVALLLPRQLPVGATVLVERILGIHAGPVLTTVVRSKHLELGWLHGAELNSPLTDEELKDWLR
jgi:hypothetical protein